MFLLTHVTSWCNALGMGRANLSKIPFPTDALILGELRTREPELFEPVTLVEQGFPSSRVFRAIGWQGALAQKAYASQAKESDPYPQYKRADIIKALDEVYQQWGLSTGTSASDELLRRIETAAQKQAIAHAKQR